MSIPVCVVGDSHLGLALASHLSVEYDVTLITETQNAANEIETTQRHPHFAHTFDLSERLRATADAAQVAKLAELIVLAVPISRLRDRLAALDGYIQDGAIVVNTISEIEFETGMTVCQVLEDLLPQTVAGRIVHLSGP